MTGEKLKVTELNVLDKGFVRLIDSMGNDSTIAETARISYLGKSSGDQSDKNIIISLIKNHHTSPLEQVEFRFLVKAPIFVARQWMRHRTWSYNEVSRRYTKKDIDFYIPDFELEVQRWLYQKSVNVSYSAYNDLIKLGTKKEVARGVLPVAMYTTFYAKTDLHNLFHFLELRLAAEAQSEIREYANAMYELIKPIVPITAEIWKNITIGEL